MHPKTLDLSELILITSTSLPYKNLYFLGWVVGGQGCIKCATAGRSKVGPRSKVRTLSGQILPHFDINNFSVAQKLTKLDSLVLVQIRLALIIALILQSV